MRRYEISLPYSGRQTLLPSSKCFFTPLLQLPSGTYTLVNFDSVSGALMKTLESTENYQLYIYHNVDPT